MSTFLQEQFGFQNMISTRCWNETDKPKNFVTPLIAILVHISMIGYGLSSDISLYYFIKKQNWKKIQSGTALVQWKSTDTYSKEDVQIPIRATIITSALILVILGISLCGMIKNENDYVMYVAVCTQLSTTFCLPLVLVTLTVKHQSKLKVSQPPNQLQFHEDKIMDIESKNIELHV